MIVQFTQVFVCGYVFVFIKRSIYTLKIISVSNRYTIDDTVGGFLLFILFIELGDL